MSTRSPACAREICRPTHGARTNEDGCHEDRIREVTLLATSALVLLLSCVLTVRGTRQVVLPVVGIALPEICGLRNTFGIDCPGCGLTRSFISVADGDLSAAWQFNPLGIVLFFVLLFQLPFRTIQLLRLRSAHRVWRLPLTAVGLLSSIAAGLVVQWIVRYVM